MACITAGGGGNRQGKEGASHKEANTGSKKIILREGEKISHFEIIKSEVKQGRLQRKKKTKCQTGENVIARKKKRR